MVVLARVMKNTAFLIATILAFSLAYAENEDCTFNLFVNEVAGNISSPNYPFPYPNSKDCTWRIQTIPGYTITLTFYDFHLERHPSDYLEVYDGDTKEDHLFGRYKGKKIPNPIMSTTNRMLVYFHSDRTVQRKGFIASYTKGPRIRYFLQVQDSKRRLTEILLNTRQEQVRSINKWGRHIARIAVSLYLNDEHVFDTGSQIGEEISLELSLELLSRLTLMKNISTKELSLYINALTVTCFDPKNFYGFNLVEELRKRVNKSNNIHPFAMFTLCNAEDVMTMDDVAKLLIQYDVHISPEGAGVQAMIVIALTCINSRSELNLNESVINGMVSELKRKQHINGTIGDWNITALVVQALMAADDYQTDFDFKAAIQDILDGINNHTNIQHIYYALPVLNSVTLANISSAHCGGSFMQTASIVSKKKEVDIQPKNKLADCKLKLIIVSTAAILFCLMIAAAAAYVIRSKRKVLESPSVDNDVKLLNHKIEGCYKKK